MRTLSILAVALLCSVGRAQTTQTFPTTHAVYEFTQTDFLCGTATETFFGVHEIGPTPIALMLFGVPTDDASNPVFAMFSAPTTSATPIGPLLGMPSSPCLLAVDFNSLFVLPMTPGGGANNLSFQVNNISASIWPLGLSLRMHPLRVGPGELSTFHALDITRVN